MLWVSRKGRKGAAAQRLLSAKAIAIWAGFYVAKVQ
jgi:hypothetical protein